MPIKINGATSGSTTITAPATGGDEVIELSTALAAKLTTPGAWTSWTPVVSQSGTRTATINYAKYQRIGNLVIANARLTLTQTGSAANNILISIPFTAAAIVYAVGDFTMLRAATRYAGTCALNDTSSIFLQANDKTNGVGNDPNTALAVGDIISISLMYEAA